MSTTRSFVRAAARWTEDLRARVALRGARVGKNVRVFGLPSVVCDGELVVGDDVEIFSTPAAVTIVVDDGATVEIGRGACIESGATLRARRRIVVAPGARVPAGAILDDAASDAPEMLVASEPSDARPQGALRQERIRSVMASVVPAAAELGPRDDVRRAAGWDSLAALRVVVALEKELGVALPHDLFTRAHTLEEVERAARGEVRS